MKFKIKNWICIVVFLVLIITPMFVWDMIGMISVENPKILEDLDFDLGEKRRKATLSEIVDVERVTIEVENYFNDRIPFRSVIITMKQQFETMIEQPYVKVIEPGLLYLFSPKKEKKEREYEVKVESVDGEISLYMDDAVDTFRGHRLKKDEIDPYNDSIAYPVKYLNTAVIMGQNNWPYLAYNNLDYYKGNNNLKENQYAKYLKPYEDLNKLCEKLGKKLIFVICPEKEEIYPEYMPTLEITDEIERPMRIREYIASNSEIKYVYPKEQLIAAKKNYRVYLKYDSHWTSIGGYLAANEIKKALGKETTPIRTWDIERAPEWKKDLLFLGGADSNSYTDGFLYNVFYKPEVEVEIKYQDDPNINNVCITRSTGTDDDVVFLVGDSYRYDLGIFFERDFKDFYCNSYLEINNPILREEVKLADIIIIEAVERHEGLIIPMIIEQLTKYLTEK